MSVLMKFFFNDVRLLLLFTLLSSLVVHSGFPARAADREHDQMQDDKNEWIKSQPVHIEADRMFSDQQRNTVVFTGNVVAIQGSLTINSEKMTVNHREEGQGEESRSKAGQGQQIEKIVATGNVRISRDDLTASGDKVIFALEEEKIFIINNARVWHKDNLVQGERVVFDLARGTTVFESGAKEGQRVKAFFYPEEE